MQNRNVELVGARTVREHVIVPCRLVKWIFRDRIAGVPVIYSDEDSFMIFDPEGRIVHVLMDCLDRPTQKRWFSYTNHPITRVILGERMTVLEVELQTEAAIADSIMTRLPTADELRELLHLAQFHQNTQLRLKRFPLRPVHSTK